jgi:hypothetical protein
LQNLILLFKAIGSKRRISLAKQAVDPKKISFYQAGFMLQPNKEK